MVDFATLDEVDDYSEYMAYSNNEKMAEMSDIICPEGKVATSYKLHEDGDGFLSRDEFDNADQDTTAIADEYCVPINDEEDKTGTKT